MFINSALDFSRDNLRLILVNRMHQLNTFALSPWRWIEVCELAENFGFRREGNTSEKTRILAAHDDFRLFDYFTAREAMLFALCMTRAFESCSGGTRQDFYAALSDFSGTGAFVVREGGG